jgi:hypothetical protein
MVEFTSTAQLAVGSMLLLFFRYLCLHRGTPGVLIRRLAKQRDKDVQ